MDVGDADDEPSIVKGEVDKVIGSDPKRIADENIGGEGEGISDRRAER